MADDENALAITYWYLFRKNKIKKSDCKLERNKKDDFGFLK